MIFAFMIIGAIFAVPVAGIAGFQYLRADGHRKQQIAVWGPIAQQRGGRMNLSQGGFSHHSIAVPGPTQAIVVAVLNGIVVDSAVAREITNFGGWNTHVQATCAVPSPSFVLGSSDRRRADRMLSPNVARMLPYLGGDATIACGGRVVTVILPGAVLDANRINAAIDTAFALAGPEPARPG
jgi:hypothetical protein